MSARALSRAGKSVAAATWAANSETKNGNQSRKTTPEQMAIRVGQSNAFFSVVPPPLDQSAPHFPLLPDTAQLLDPAHFSTAMRWTEAACPWRTRIRPAWRGAQSRDLAPGGRAGRDRFPSCVLMQLDVRRRLCRSRCMHDGEVDSMENVVGFPQEAAASVPRRPGRLAVVARCQIPRSLAAGNVANQSFDRHSLKGREYTKLRPRSRQQRKEGTTTHSERRETKNPERRNHGTHETHEKKAVIRCYHTTSSERPARLLGILIGRRTRCPSYNENATIGSTDSSRHPFPPCTTDILSVAIISYAVLRGRVAPIPRRFRRRRTRCPSYE